MRKVIVVLLLVLVPLQISYAALTSAFGHEAASCAGQHFGHHAHEHDAGIDPAQHDHDRGGAGFHDDCGFCHFNCLKFAAPAPLHARANLRAGFAPARQNTPATIAPEGLYRPPLALRA